MNKTPRLSKSGIEYLNYAWNFYSGCHHKKMGVCQVENCWAEGITKRMNHNYPNGFEPTVYPEAFLSPLHLKKPRIIGCAFMGDLFGDWVAPEQKIHADMPSGKASITMSLKGWIFTTIRKCPQHRFLFLTKASRNLIKWSPFPDNCWVGVTATDAKMFKDAIYGLYAIKAKVKYVSLEPMLERLYHELYVCQDMIDKLMLIDWVIIGSQTKPNIYAKEEWIKEIEDACDKANIPVFEKTNLRKVWYNSPRQEIPEV